jgi:hypothetical protein
MRNLLPNAAIWIVILTAACSAQSISTQTQTVSAQIQAMGSIVSVPGTVTLSSGGINFQNYTGSLTVTYRARTTPSGTGNLTVQGTTDFSATTGPRISAGALTYTCSGVTLGTGCSGTQTMSMSSATNVVTLPSSACTGGAPCPLSTPDPNQVVMGLSLTNDPAYPTGSYSASITFTISAI